MGMKGINMATGQKHTYGTASSVFGHRMALTPRKIASLVDTGIEWIEISAMQPLHLDIWDQQSIDDLKASFASIPLKVWEVKGQPSQYTLLALARVMSTITRLRDSLAFCVFQAFLSLSAPRKVAGLHRLETETCVRCANRPPFGR